MANPMNSVKHFLFESGSSSDATGRFIWISKTDLRIDPRYQRKPKGVDTINKIARSFSWMAFGCLSVTERRNGYFVYDGQHRLLAAMRLENIDKLPCLVFKTDAIEEEANGFVKTNIARSPVRSLDSFRAAVVARDPIAINVNSLLTDLKVVLTDRPVHYAETKSLGSMWKYYRLNPVALRNAIMAALAATKKDDTPLLERMFTGLYYLDTHLESGVTEPRFMQRIASIGGQPLLDGIYRASAYHVAGGAKVFALGILDVVNHGLRNRYIMKSDEQN